MKKILGYLSIGLLSQQLWAACQMGMLWQVTSPQSPPSLLFASFHTEDARVLEMLDCLTPLLEKADRVAFELLKDIPTLRSLSAQILTQDAHSLDTVIPPSLYQEVETWLQATHGLSPFLIQRLQLWAVISLLNAPPAKTGVYADWQIYQRVMELGKAPYPLEKGEESVDLGSKLSLEEQLNLIARGMQKNVDVSAVNRQLVETYLQEDFEEMAAIFWGSSVYGGVPAVTLRLQREMKRRNEGLIQGMKPLLEAGNVVFVVSALRLGGNEGVLQKLQESGYKVSAVRH